MIFVDLNIRGEEEEQILILLHVAAHASKEHRTVYYFETNDFILGVHLLEDHFEFVPDCLNSVCFKVKVRVRLFRVEFYL